MRDSSVCLSVDSFQVVPFVRLKSSQDVVHFKLVELYVHKPTTKPDGYSFFMNVNQRVAIWTSISKIFYFTHLLYTKKVYKVVCK